MQEDIEQNIIIVLKDKKTNLILKELDVCSLNYDSKLVNSIFAYLENEIIYIEIELTTQKDVLDWEFNAVLDYYDMDIFDKYDIFEQEESYNPCWNVRFLYDDDFQKTVNEVLKLHLYEINQVFDVIKDKEIEYTNPKNVN